MSFEEENQACIKRLEAMGFKRVPEFAVDVYRKDLTTKQPNVHIDVETHPEVGRQDGKLTRSTCIRITITSGFEKSLIMDLPSLNTFLDSIPPPKKPELKRGPRGPRKPKS